jgi:hypothetical protein
MLIFIGAVSLFVFLTGGAIVYCISKKYHLSKNRLKGELREEVARGLGLD